jgi:hypothetical protein
MFHVTQLFSKLLNILKQISGRILASFEQKRRTLKKLIPSSYPLYFYGSTRNFPTDTDQKSVFLEKLKFTRGQNFFPQRQNFSSRLAEKFCKKLATLAKLLKKASS